MSTSNTNCSLQFNTVTTHCLHFRSFHFAGSNHGSENHLTLYSFLDAARFLNL